VSRTVQETAAPFVPAEHRLPVLAQALPDCRGCDLYRYALHAVPGQGRPHVELMLVGEQPGDEEDKQALPFVGPAGQMLNRALAELRIAREDVYVTNAVKHFKFVEKGKRRIHQTPRMSEILACRPWLQAELDAVKPRVLVVLGASAAKSLLGSKFALMKQRGTLVSSPYADCVVATIHPSAVLRAPDHDAREAMYQLFRQDLAFAHTVALKSA
jgi:uracil-DNA glycosylase family protein